MKEMTQEEQSEFAIKMGKSILDAFNKKKLNTIQALSFTSGIAGLVYLNIAGTNLKRYDNTILLEKSTVEMFCDQIHDSIAKNLDALIEKVNKKK